MTALAGYGGIFRRSALASGVIPQISVMLGPCAGGAAYSPALTDFVFMVRGIAQMFLTGPDVVRSVTGEEVTHGELGGADVHTSLSGVAHAAYDDEQSCLEDVRHLLSMLPANNRELPPVEEGGDPVDRRCAADLVPVDGAVPYDVRAVIEEIVDDGGSRTATRGAEPEGSGRPGRRSGQHRSGCPARPARPARPGPVR